MILTNQYLVQKRLGEYKLGNPEILSFEEFQKYNFDKSISEYWSKRSKDRSGQQNKDMGIPNCIFQDKL